MMLAVSSLLLVLLLLLCLVERLVMLDRLGNKREDGIQLLLKAPSLVVDSSSVLYSSSSPCVCPLDVLP